MTVSYSSEPVGSVRKLIFQLIFRAGHDDLKQFSYPEMHLVWLVSVFLRSVTHWKQFPGRIFKIAASSCYPFSYVINKIGFKWSSINVTKKFLSLWLMFKTDLIKYPFYPTLLGLLMPAIFISNLAFSLVLVLLNFRARTSAPVAKTISSWVQFKLTHFFFSIIFLIFCEHFA